MEIGEVVTKRRLRVCYTSTLKIRSHPPKTQKTHPCTAFRKSYKPCRAAPWSCGRRGCLPDTSRRQWGSPTPPMPFCCLPPSADTPAPPFSSCCWVCRLRETHANRNSTLPACLFDDCLLAPPASLELQCAETQYYSFGRRFLRDIVGGRVCGRPGRSLPRGSFGGRWCSKNI